MSISSVFVVLDRFHIIVIERSRLDFNNTTVCINNHANSFVYDKLLISI